MGKCTKLLAKATYSPSNLSFREICSLAECYGWKYRRRNGSHRIFSNALLDLSQGQRMNFQPDRNNKAKAYQVKQLLKAIEVLKENKR